MAAKYLNDPITKEDVESYIRNESDFGFELSVLDEIKKHDFIYKHSGSYEDPVLQKTREFDILAKKSIHNNCLFLAVECKNFKRSFPLVIHCTQRTSEESYNEIIIPNNNQRFNINDPFPPAATVLRLKHPSSIYKVNDRTGKSTEQIGKKENQGKDNSSINFTSNDSEIFDKISQAINSSYSQIIEASHQPPGTHNLIFPVLVIPNETLWAVDYSVNVEHEWSVSSANHISYYIGKEWTTKEKVPAQRITYNLSHLEIVTIGYLETFINHLIPTLMNT